MGAGREPLASGLYAAEHRALRELHAMTSQLETHWDRLGERLGGPAGETLADGASSARELLGELGERTGAHGLHGFPAAQGVGGRLASLRNVAGDLLLERNQALRSALLDIQHVVTLLEYLAGLAATRHDADLEAWHIGWRDRLRAIEDRGRAAVAAITDDPDRAVEPADDGPLGRAGAKVGVALGAVGEAIDNSPLGQLAHRRST